MTAEDLTVAGIRFRTRVDYEAALRDQKKIDAIRARINLSNPKELFKLFSVLQSGSYRFETQLGRNFDDEIYEKIENLKKQGITPVNAGQIRKEPDQRAHRFGKAKKAAVFADNENGKEPSKSRINKACIYFMRLFYNFHDIFVCVLNKGKNRHEQNSGK